MRRDLKEDKEMFLEETILKPFSGKRSWYFIGIIAEVRTWESDGKIIDDLTGHCMDFDTA